MLIFFDLKDKICMPLVRVIELADQPHLKKSKHVCEPKQSAINASVTGYRKSSFIRFR